MKNQIINLLENYPSFLTSEHLVDLGIYKNTDSAYHARTNSHSPPWIKLKHKVIYPKFGVIDFLVDRMEQESSSSISNNKITAKED